MQLLQCSFILLCFGISSLMDASWFVSIPFTFRFYSLGFSAITQRVLEQFLYVITIWVSSSTQTQSSITSCSLAFTHVLFCCQHSSADLCMRWIQPLSKLLKIQGRLKDTETTKSLKNRSNGSTEVMYNATSSNHTGLMWKKLNRLHRGHHICT